MSTFKRATKKSARARVALCGPAGSGKTYTALAIAAALGKRIAVVDSERGSASKYANRLAFDVLELESFEPHRYVEAIEAAEREGYEVVVVDSLSHAWMGKGGALELVDRAAAKTRTSFEAWRTVTPQHNALVDAMLRSRCHVVATMRTKTEYVMEKNDQGKTVPRKVGLAPVQRDGVEYEFDVVGDLDDAHRLTISKSRCEALADQVIDRPGRRLGETLLEWLSDGVAPAAAPAASPPYDPAEQPGPREMREAMKEAQDDPDATLRARVIAAGDVGTLGTLAIEASRLNDDAALELAYARSMGLAGSVAELDAIAAALKGEPLLGRLDRKRLVAAYSERAAALRGAA